MSAQPDTKPKWFDAFVKSSQYIVRLKSQQDIWDHLAALIVTYFPAAWIAFARRDGVHGNPPSPRHPGSGSRRAGRGAGF